MARPAHQWDTSGVKHMKIEDEVLPASNVAPILDHMEAERYVESLKKFDISEVGTSQWMEQHRKFEKLNIQAHQNAMTNSEEFILASFLTFNKLDTLLHDLLLIEIWKESVYPLLLETLAGRNNMRLYFILYHEATLINLLEVFMYYRHVCEAGGEKFLELVDYVGRKLTRLNNTSYEFRQHDVDPDDVGMTAESAKSFAATLEARSPEEELKKHFMDIELRICISAVSIARFLSEHADAMPLSVVSRITDTHDFLLLFVPLIENPPWTRRLNSGKWQKLVDHKWTEVKPIDLLKITKLEGQPWLAVYYLLAKEVFRERYFLNSFRKNQLLRVRKYINELMLDQLPFLADIQRYMDELAVTEVPEPTSLGNSVFLFQQVAVMREAIQKGKKWPEVAQLQIQTVFTMTDKNDKDLLMMADLYSDDLGDAMVDTDPVV
eukprot:CAMPEP_0184969528 /NCGR_PEP_ID=MMETSP1098-20130426/2253_1 /TAXON_ID=89044 /ORGANISM="Spumella elongata, Strain CCAP 955/1" /LENGTH=435 /DNA_ID=CAMNT_0027491297 /DNA_START=29 /DNA_END=1336 /DNA_ORIENTATION=+